METPINAVNQIAKMTSAKVEEVGLLPDGSGFAVLSMPLPKDHWLYEDNPEPPPAPLLMGTDNPLRKPLAKAIREAGKYAIRATTESGKSDYDPDAWLQNLVVAMLGYWTDDGRSHI